MKILCAGSLNMVRHAGAVGADGGLLRQTLRQAGVDDSLLAESSLPTGHAIIQVDPKGQNSIIVTAGANGALERDYLSAMLNGCEAGDILLLQNETNELPWLLQEGRRRGLTVAFNPSPITPELLEATAASAGENRMKLELAPRPVPVAESRGILSALLKQTYEGTLQSW